MLPILILLLAGCGRDEPAPGNGTGPAAAPSGRSSPRADAPAAADDRLAGLYESPAGAQKNQLCIVEKGGESQFGLIVWGGNLHSCSGAGVAERRGARLSLRMTGDETCAIEATIEDGLITLPATLPSGCAYYCGARASLAGARFVRAGSTEADARKATDIAGDPLCG